MKFTCPHCGANAFRLLAGANGVPATECLGCGRASTFDQSLVSNPATRPGTPQPEWRDGVSMPKAQSLPNHHSSGVFDRNTAERNSAIIRHWKFGLTQTGIGRLMGVSRSIVAGVLTRAREDGLIGQLELEDAAARRKANWAKGYEKQQLVQGGGEALANVQTRDCRYPIGHPGAAGFRFCRQPRHGSGPYCLHHRRVCYAKVGAANGILS